MDKPETQAVLRQDTEWTTRDTGSIETRHKMDKSEKQAVLREIGHKTQRHGQARMDKQRQYLRQDT